jgi:hypothetical protein
MRPPPSRPELIHIVSLPAPFSAFCASLFANSLDSDPICGRYECGLINSDSRDTQVIPSMDLRNEVLL